MNKTTRNLLLKIKNSSTVKLNESYIRYSKKNIELLEVLYDEGFIQSFNVINLNSVIRIYLNYYDNKSSLAHLKIFSTKRDNSNNLKFLELARLSNKRFVLFLTTSQGLASGFACRNNHFSGKLLFLC